ncbi:hypothetical protein CTheo_1642 [Ceratobasidium theobromae]|uniref:Uncharacterized protein n=1 Tax=Ceratobasidium theobromae TaxID=1582974 RepID=A0A5N5QTQ1_9AGAM|nr:hypothetical protein CTheo_1642 [Ceratobasidium theobromae]
MSWILYLNLGLITNEDSMEDPTMMLSEELTSTYIKDKGGEVKKTFAHVGKGKFLIYDEGDPDQYAPDDMWSCACPKHQLTLEKAGDPEEDTL